MNTWTKEEIEREIEKAKEASRAHFDKYKEHISVFLVFATVDPTTEVEGPFVAPFCPAHQCPDLNPDQVAQLIQFSCRETRAIGVISVHEAWMAPFEAPPGTSREDLQKMVSQRKPPSEDPNKVEVLMITCEFVDGPNQLMVAEIDRTSGSPVLGEWEVKQGHSRGGRLSNFLRYLS